MSLDPLTERTIREGLEPLIAGGTFACGENVRALEAAFAEYVGVEHAVALSSCSAALELQVRIAGAVAGDEILVQSNTSFATLMAPLRCGVDARLIDVSPTTLAPSAADVAEAIGPRTVGLILVHMGGIVGPDTEAIMSLCAKRAIWVLEDCAHAHGSRLDGRHAGTFGQSGAFSFFSTKLVPAGEGGMLITDDADLAREARLHRSLGKQPNARNLHVRDGTNARMTEVAALVARAQLLSLDARVRHRRDVLQRYAERLRDHPEAKLLQGPGDDNGYRAVVLLGTHVDRDAVRKHLVDEGVRPANEIYPIPLHFQPALQARYGDLDLPGAQRACLQQICLPLDDGTSLDDADRAVAVLSRALAAAARVGSA